MKPRLESISDKFPILKHDDDFSHRMSNGPISLGLSTSNFVETKGGSKHSASHSTTKAEKPPSRKQDSDGSDDFLEQISDSELESSSSRSSKRKSSKSHKSHDSKSKSRKSHDSVKSSSHDHEVYAANPDAIEPLIVVPVAVPVVPEPVVKEESKKSKDSSKKSKSKSSSKSKDCGCDEPKKKSHSKSKSKSHEDDDEDSFFKNIQSSSKSKSKSSSSSEESKDGKGAKEFKEFKEILDLVIEDDLLEEPTKVHAKMVDHVADLVEECDAHKVTKYIQKKLAELLEEGYKPHPLTVGSFFFGCYLPDGSYPTNKYCDAVCAFSLPNFTDDRQGCTVNVVYFKDNVSHIKINAGHDVTAVHLGDSCTLDKLEGIQLEVLRSVGTKQAVLFRHGRHYKNVDISDDCTSLDISKPEEQKSSSSHDSKKKSSSSHDEKKKSSSSCDEDSKHKSSDSSFSSETKCAPSSDSSCPPPHSEPECKRKDSSDDDCCSSGFNVEGGSVWFFVILLIFLVIYFYAGRRALSF